MFGNFSWLVPLPVPTKSPKDVPRATPVRFPQCCPRPVDGSHVARVKRAPLAGLLQTAVRPDDVDVSFLEALGVHVTSDVGPDDLIPDPALIPDFAAWQALPSDEAFKLNESTRKRLSNGNLSPGLRVYVERWRELSLSNEEAFRAIKRIPPLKGKSQARLGNAFNFYRHLEALSTFWDDTSKPKETDGEIMAGHEKKASRDSDDTEPNLFRYYRTAAGHQMPVDHRQQIVQAFMKLVAYDYGCNVSMARTEPRLYVKHDPSTCKSIANAAASTSSPSWHRDPCPPYRRCTHFTSGCTFVYRTPTTREEARAGVVEGPLLSISARHAIFFPEQSSDPQSAPDKESTLDLARELIAALITAQNRAREGCTEQRPGQGAWWTTRPRWGGGPGGPIGREGDVAEGLDVAVDDEDEPSPQILPVPSPSSHTTTAPSTPINSSSSTPSPHFCFSSSSKRPVSLSPTLPASSSAVPDTSFLICRPSSRIAVAATKSVNKRIKKSANGGNLSMYDNYRMIRPPAANWDRKTRYQAIGRCRGAGVDYDNVFVVSSLFHHVSILRMRVPDRLLGVLEGSCDDWILQHDQDDDKETQQRLVRSWGGLLEVKRSRWFDFFRKEDRVEAMRLVWCILAYLMRADVGGGDGKNVTMAEK